VSDRQVIKPFDDGPSELRKAIAAAALPIALFLAVVVQLTVVNRLPLPGGDAPDLVLLLVAAVAVTSNPMVAVLTGFVGGLALDIAPPVSHYAGEYALIFCLVGYLAARVMAAISAASGGAERDPAVALAVMAVAAAAGEAGKAGLGLLLSDPNVTGPVIRHVLPGAVLYDLVLTPVVYWLVVRVARLARPVSERAPAPVFFGPQRLASVFRSASTGAAPNLRLAGTGAKYSDSRPVRREPNLHLADGRSKSLARTDRAVTNGAQPLLAGGRVAKLNFAHSKSAVRNPVGALAGRATKLNFAHSRSALRSGGSAPGGRVTKLNFAHSPSALGNRGSAIARRATKLNFSHSRGTLRDRGAALGPSALSGAAPGPRRTPKLNFAGDSMSTIRPRRRKSPGKGWLDDSRRKPPTAKRATPGKGWLRPARPPRPNWYSSGPTTGWIRRSRAKNRWRTRRRSLSGSLMSTVRDLLPMGERR
jgi:rod shape-determining protein MreD